MKYICVLGDGMADEPLDSLDGKTPLEYAHTPNLNALAQISEVGLCNTVPDGLAAGSDVANMSVMGFDPKRFYTGRSPLEAVALGINLSPEDVTLRCNLVTLSNDEPYENKVMLDYSADEISTGEAAVLINALKKEFDSEKFNFVAGKSYRHCLVVHGGICGHEFTPPHEIYKQAVGGFLPKGPLAETYIDFMKRSYEILSNHPVNLKRIANGKKSANGIWFWGEGKSPALPDFSSTFKKKGGLITAVDLVRGLGILSGMQVFQPDGITGNYDTDFKIKAKTAIEALKGGLDFVYIHIEAPDECSHHGDAIKKILSIEQIDRLVIKTILDEEEQLDEDFALLVCPDHPTSCNTRSHMSSPVPYLLYNSKRKHKKVAERYTEAEAAKTGKYVKNGYTLIQKLFSVN